jgi:hypothetical protein
MVVFGDRFERVRLDDGLDEVLALLARAGQPGPWIARHEKLACALVEAGRLATALADLELEARGIDGCGPTSEPALGLCRLIAAALARSWRGEAPDAALARAAATAQAALRRERGALELRLNSPEGYAHYAVYPEAFLDAAAQARPDIVIGLRSIGTSLAAAVAAQAGAERLITLRPRGYQNERVLAPDPALIGRITSDTATRIAIVDEGPGLSGSSFASTVELLRAAGVGSGRIVLIPSHAGAPGGAATAETLALWPGLDRRPADFEAAFLAPARRRLETWFADLTGAPAGPLQDLSAGAWRSHFDWGTAGPPAVDACRERRKYRLQTSQGDYLLKFSGLGRGATAKFQRARRLQAAGFCPPALALRHGFLLQPWLDGWRPLSAAHVERGRLLGTLGAYLAFRARAFPGSPAEAAPMRSLSEMARHNAGALLGSSAGRIEALLAPLADVRPAPVHVDGRLHPSEWLVSPRGDLVKTDAIDHSTDHFLIGAQDIAWDIAGAAVEFGLDEEERAALAAAAAGDARPRPPAVLRAYETCYLAFEAARWSLALASAAEGESGAVRTRAEGYRRRLVRLLRVEDPLEV